MSDQNLELRIQSANQLLFKGTVKSVSTHNTKGDFDILPFHENFISLIDSKISFIDLEGRKKEFPVDLGAIRVEENKIEALLGIGK